MKWYEFKAKGKDTTEVFLYDEIGQDWYGDGTAAKDFARDLADIKTPNIHLRVNSPGGAVFDGQAIYSAIVRHPASVTAYVDGLAASIASLIVQAADKRVMASNALMMVHNSWGAVMGNASDMRETADVLEKVDSTLVGIYAGATGQPESHVREVMADETWFTAEEAVAFGLADEMAEPMKVAASFDLSRFKHPPVALIETPEQVPDPEPAASVPDPDGDTEPESVADGDAAEAQAEEAKTRYPLPPL